MIMRTGSLAAHYFPEALSTGLVLLMQGPTIKSVLMRVGEKVSAMATLVPKMPILTLSSQVEFSLSRDVVGLSRSHPCQQESAREASRLLVCQTDRPHDMQEETRRSQGKWSTPIALRTVFDRHKTPAISTRCPSCGKVNDRQTHALSWMTI